MTRCAMTLKALTAETHLTSHEVAKLLQVNVTSINAWSDTGKIPRYTTPGGHRRFVASDVVTFINKIGMPMPAALRGVA